MIPKHIGRKESADNYRALALYVADASIGKEPGEKTLHCWYAGGQAETFLEGLVEVEATQALNTRSKADKTYHLMVSFRSEDEDKLTAETLKEIEAKLAEALGFEDHQRHCGVHRNTANLHLHVAYNAINPLTFNRHSPYHDYLKLTKACRAIEQEYGLAVDAGMGDHERMDGRPGNKVLALEAQTGQESLFSYVQRHKPELMAALGAAGNWDDLHTAFLKRGLSLKPKGNGLVVQDSHGRHAIKASEVERSLSRARLESKFGLFTAPDRIFQAVKPDTVYTAAPLRRGPERDQLYAIFQEEMRQRRAALEAADHEDRLRYEECRERWGGKWREIKKLPMFKAARQGGHPGRSNFPQERHRPAPTDHRAGQGQTSIHPGSGGHHQSSERTVQSRSRPAIRRLTA